MLRLLAIYPTRAADFAGSVAEQNDQLTAPAKIIGLDGSYR